MQWHLLFYRRQYRQKSGEECTGSTGHVERLHHIEDILIEEILSTYMYRQRAEFLFQLHQEH